MQFEPWDDGTRKQMLIKMRRIRRALGERAVNLTDRMFLEAWLTSFCTRADVFNKWRCAPILLWKFAESRKLADLCEPEKIEPRSTSKKIPSNRKVRKQLDLDGFKAIHAQAPDWLRLAMEQSLVTLQARQEICNLRHTDYRDGYLFVIRDEP
ncbi:MAG: intE [Gammaproteobacteria bacterium]|nr:intE [Gammaproteobacteria bacterium]